MSIDQCCKCHGTEIKHSFVGLLMSVVVASGLGSYWWRGKVWSSAIASFLGASTL